jgi:hypothetical protein
VFARQDRISSRPTNSSLRSLLCDPEHVSSIPRYRKVASISHSGTAGRVQTRFSVMTTPFLLLITTYSSGKSKSALRKPNLNILYEIGHRITKLDSQLGTAGRAES